MKLFKHKHKFALGSFNEGTSVPSKEWYANAVWVCVCGEHLDVHYTTAPERIK